MNARREDVAYVFAGGRSGETPKRLLGGTKGTLIVDGYSGYNVVAEVSRRKRAACHAHLRRYLRGSQAALRGLANISICMTRLPNA